MYINIDSKNVCENKEVKHISGEDSWRILGQSEK
jgi:hypothetical protein